MERDKEQEWGIRGTKTVAEIGKAGAMSGRIVASFAVSHGWASETANVVTGKYI